VIKGIYLFRLKKHRNSPKKRYFKNTRNETAGVPLQSKGVILFQIFGGVHNLFISFFCHEGGGEGIFSD